MTPELRRTVFYSWQSDSDQKLNRYFIEGALKAAIKQLNQDSDVVNKQLGKLPLVFDKDTSSTSGTPAITDTLLGKISSASVFVGDLSLVGRRKGKKLPEMPNSNVVMEWGYALGRIGPSHVVGVLNGSPMECDRLPFNFRGRRYPIIYKLTDSRDCPEKRTIKSALVADLAIAVKEVLKFETHANLTWREGGFFTHIGKLPAGQDTTEVSVPESVHWPRTLIDWSPKNDLLVFGGGRGNRLQIFRAKHVPKEREITFGCRLNVLPHPSPG